MLHHNMIHNSISYYNISRQEVQRRPVSLHIYDVSQFEGVQRLNAAPAECSNNDNNSLIIES